jgi:hypothetical protein
MGTIRDLAVAAFVNAFISVIVKIFIDYLWEKGKTLWQVIKDKWRRNLLYAVIGLVIGPAGLILISGWYQKPLWTFDQSTEGWVYNTRNMKDASSDISWDAGTRSLRAEFDFGQIDLGTLSAGEEPRATFFIDNLDDDWSGYKTLILNVANPNPLPLEVTFSVYIDGCFYEFGGYRNLPPNQTKSTTVTFNFTEPRYKTCESPYSFSNPLGPTDHIQRFDLIVGINVAPKILKQARGAILIDNIRLQKDVWFLQIGAGVVVLVVVFVIALIEYLRKQPRG